jgi:membrane-associated protease RseP (regulator of RpoE activity)
MRSRLFTLAIALLVTAGALAEKPVSRTIVIRDGKVITDNAQVFDLSDTLAGGKRAYLGVSTIDISPSLREHFGTDRDAGVLVDSVEEQSPAAKAGIRSGDVIVSVDGKDVKSASDLRGAIREKKDGDTVRIEVQRGRNRTALVATLAEREGPRILFQRDLEELTSRLGSGPEWRARVESFGGDCDELRSRIRDLESRLRELEKKLQK